jgi:putative nucleotidyltransferase with HDIG domain
MPMHNKAAMPLKDGGAIAMKLNIQIDEQDLPLISTVATQALDLLKDTKVSNRKMEDLICQDPALTARILRAANSPFYRGRMQAATISDAIFRLGMRQLHNVIVLAATGEFFSDSDPIVQYLWNHSISTAMAANFISDRLHFSQMEEVFVAGLLHDIGKLIILRQHPTVYAPLAVQALENDIPMAQVEEENFNYFNHMTIGGLVVRRWQLHDAISEVARFHHDVENDIPMVLNHEQMVCVIALANALSKMAMRNVAPAGAGKLAGMAYAANLRLGEKKLVEIATQIFTGIQTQQLSLA